MALFPEAGMMDSHLNEKVSRQICLVGSNTSFTLGDCSLQHPFLDYSQPVSWGRELTASAAPSKIVVPAYTEGWLPGICPHPTLMPCK